MIPDVRSWVGRRHGSVTFHLIQALTGHECFAAYLNRFGLLESPECWFCGNSNDSAEHTIFECAAWSEGRAALAAKIGPLDPQNLVTKMVESRMVRFIQKKFLTKIVNCWKYYLTINS